MLLHPLKILVFFVILTFSSYEQIYFEGAGVIDNDGNFLESIVLGNGQEWITTNLNVTHFSNGTPIRHCADQFEWTNSITPCYTQYPNQTNLITQAGYLYNFYSVVDEKNVCPLGWRVPNELDWSKFSSYLGGLAIAGGKMKSTSNDHWSNPNIGATNEINFSAIAAGCRYDQGFFNNFNTYAFFWTASELDDNLAWYRSLKYNSDEMIRNFSKKQNGYSIRCMRDLESSIIDNLDFTFIMSPNPVSDFMEITLNKEIELQIREIIITDMSGHVKFLEKQFAPIIDMSNFPSGVYFLEVRTAVFNSKRLFVKI
jgi:uncharacterized protein (TIGR02145 family)